MKFIKLSNSWIDLDSVVGIMERPGDPKTERPIDKKSSYSISLLGDGNRYGGYTMENINYLLDQLREREKELNEEF